ncbi:MAG TPA: redoxin family protein [Dehalococcoidia bacterium]|nr:redoxin family protein [Dehalococcoidia bacterium]
MTQEDARVRAPDLVGGYWVNSEPLNIADLRGKAALIDFWDYTCVNCIRTLPYVIGWHQRYREAGLQVVGVHAPEFSFAKELDGVKAAIASFGIEYPVVMDNGYSIWQAYANRYWPAKYLVDKDGYIRYHHFGEGAYTETEEAIQALLREIDGAVVLPEPMPPVRESDTPGAVCYRVTPEIYLGYQRGGIGNPSGLVTKQTAAYRDPGMHAEGYFYLDGEWRWDEEQVMKPAGSTSESRLTIRYTAKEVNLVMNPLLGRTCRVRVLLDGEPIPESHAAEDVRTEGGDGVVEVDGPRMYRLVNSPEIGSHELTLVTSDAGVAMYAFTFVSCVVPAGA